MPWWQLCTLLAFSQPASPGMLSNSLEGVPTYAEHLLAVFCSLCGPTHHKPSQLGRCRIVEVTSSDAALITWNNMLTHSETTESRLKVGRDRELSEANGGRVSSTRALWRLERAALREAWRWSSSQCVTCQVSVVSQIASTVFPACSTAVNILQKRMPLCSYTPKDTHKCTHTHTHAHSQAHTHLCACT
jgi:hypothetical protein